MQMAASEPETRPAALRLRGLVQLLLLLLTQLFFVLPPSGVAAEPFRITGINPTRGSIFGGTLVTISGTGFSTRPSENVVQMGDAENGAICTVNSYWSTNSQLLCVTAPYRMGGDVWLSVRINATFADCSVWQGCQFHFTFDATPIVNTIRPRRISAPERVTIQGSRISIGDSSPLHRDADVFIGGQRCDFAGSVCELKHARPGIRQPRVGVRRWGDAIINAPPPLVVPEIDRVFPEVGSVAGGTRVTIFGSGFEPEITKTEAKIHGVPCRVVSVTFSMIVCVTGAHPDTDGKPSLDASSARRGGALAEYWPHGISNLYTQLYDTELNQNPVMSRFIDEWEVGEVPFIEGCASCVVRTTTWFVPNATGGHRFFLRGSGTIELWFNPEDESEVPQRLESFNVPRLTPRGRGFDGWRVMNNSYHVMTRSWPQAASPPFVLEEGKRYWLRSFVKHEEEGEPAPSIDVIIESPLEDGNRTNNTRNTGGSRDSCATHYTTSFIATVGGEYVVFLEANDYAEVWISEDVDFFAWADTTEAHRRRIAHATGFSTSFANPRNPETWSETFNLTQGKAYWMRLMWEPRATTLTTSSAEQAQLMVEVPCCGVNDSAINVTNDLRKLVTHFEATTRAIAVTSNGFEADCGKSETCLVKSANAFLYSAPLTPRVTSVAPIAVSVGTEVTLTGTKFDLHEWPTVELGGATCLVTVVTATEMRCTVMEVVGGTHAVTVHFPNFGNAITSAWVTAAVSVVSIEPHNGSTRGDTQLTISGMGFGRDGDRARLTVAICGAPCDISSVSNTQIVCATRPHTAATCSVEVGLVNAVSSQLRHSFTFAQVHVVPGTDIDSGAEAPIKTQIFPTSGASQGGFTMEGFIEGVILSNPVDVVVDIVPSNTDFPPRRCPVFQVFDSKFTCNVPPTPPGDARVIATTAWATVHEMGNYTSHDSYSIALNAQFGPNGGNIVGIRYSMFNPTPLSGFEIYIAGRKCPLVRSYEIANYLECFFGVAEPDMGSLPLLAHFDLRGSDLVPYSAFFRSPTVAKTEHGVYVPPGTFFMTKQRFRRPIRIEAIVRLTTANNSVLPPPPQFPGMSTVSPHCVELHLMAEDHTSTTTGFEAFVASRTRTTDFPRAGIRSATTFNSGGVPEGFPPIESFAHTNAADHNFTVMAFRNKIEFWVDGLLIDTMNVATTTRTDGLIGFMDSCQAIVVRSLTLHDLSQTTLQLRHNGVQLPNNNIDIRHCTTCDREHRTFMLYSNPPAARVGDEIRIMMHRLGNSVHSRFYLFPSGAPPEWTEPVVDSLLCVRGSTTSTSTSTLSSSLPDLYNTFWYGVDNAPHLQESRCEILPGLRAGSYEIHAHDRNGGFLNSSIPFTLHPTISSRAPATLGAAGGRLTINGAAFPLDGASVTITVGEDVCSVVEGSYSYVVCQLGAVPPGADKRVNVSVDGVLAPCAAATCVVSVSAGESATVTAVTPTPGITAVNRITISGSNLGSSSHVRIGSDSCRTLTGGATQIVCTLPPRAQAAASLPLVVYGPTSLATHGGLTVTLVEGRPGYSHPQTAAAGADLYVHGIGLDGHGTMVTLQTIETWQLSAFPRKRVCAAPVGTVNGPFEASTRLLHRIVDIPAHHAIGVSFHLVMFPDPNRGTHVSDRVELVVDGQNFTFTGDSWWCRSGWCTTGTTECLLDVALTVPHTADHVTLELISDRLFAISETVVRYSTSPVASDVAVGGVPCEVVARHHTFVHCTVPAGTGSNLDVTLNGESCSECKFTYSSALPPQPSAVFVGAAPESTSFAPTLALRGCAVSDAPGSVFKSTSGDCNDNTGTGFADSSASSVEAIPRDEFIAVSWSFTNLDGMSGCRSAVSIAGEPDLWGGIVGREFAYGIKKDDSGSSISTGSTASATFFNPWSYNERRIIVADNNRNLVFEAEGARSRPVEYRIECVDASCSVIHYLRDGVFLHASAAPATMKTIRIDITIANAFCGVDDIRFHTRNVVARVPVFVAGSNFREFTSITAVINGEHVASTHVSRSLATFFVPSSAFASPTADVSVVLRDSLGESAAAILTPGPFVLRALHSSGASNGGHVQHVFGAGLLSQDVQPHHCIELSRSNYAIKCQTLRSDDGDSFPVVAGSAPCFPTPCPTYTATASTDIVLSNLSTLLLSEWSYITVDGGNFRGSSTNQQYPRLEFGPNRCDTWAPQLSVSVFTCRVQRGVVAGYYDARVVVDRVGASENITVMVPLRVNATTSVALGTNAGERFTLFGAAFGLNSSPQGVTLVDAGSTPVCSEIDRRDTRLVCVTTGGPHSGPFVLQVGDAEPVEIAHVTISSAFDPVVTAVSPTTAAGGDILVVSGSNLHHATFFVGGTPCRLLGENEPGTFVCRIDGPLEAGDHAFTTPDSSVPPSIVVTARFALFEVVRPPGMRAFGPGMDLVLLASGLAPATKSYSVALEDAECAITNVNATAVTCTVPDPARYFGRNSDVTLSEVDATAAPPAVASDKYDYLVSPTVAGLSPDSGPAIGGVRITLTGSGFDPDVAENTVHIGGAWCPTEFVAATLDLLVCVTGPMPINPSAAVELRLTGYGAAEVPSSLTFNAFMSVSSIATPAAAPGSAVSSSLEGGLLLTLTGAGFSNNPAENAVLIGDVSCPLDLTAPQSSTSIVCTIPPGPITAHTSFLSAYPVRADASVPVHVRSKGIVLNSTGMTVDYNGAATPRIFSVSAADDIVPDGTLITITGSGFQSAGNIVLTRHRILGTEDPCVIVSESATSIECTVRVTRVGLVTVQLFHPDHGWALSERACPGGKYLSCNGECLSDFPDCSLLARDATGCAPIFSLVFGDGFCDSTGGADAINLPLLLDGGKALTLGCPMYGCEGGDCGGRFVPHGGFDLSSSCRADPNGFLFQVVAAVSSIAPLSSVRLGGRYITITGTKLSMNDTRLLFLPFTNWIPGVNGVSLNNIQSSPYAAGNLHAQQQTQENWSQDAVPCDPLSSEDSSTLICITTTAPRPGNYTMVVVSGGLLSLCPQCETSLFYFHEEYPIVTALHVGWGVNHTYLLAVEGLKFGLVGVHEIYVDGERCHEGGEFLRVSPTVPATSTQTWSRSRPPTRTSTDTVTPSLPPTRTVTLTQTSRTLSSTYVSVTRTLPATKSRTSSSSLPRTATPSLSATSISRTPTEHHVAVAGVGSRTRSVSLTTSLTTTLTTSILHTATTTAGSQTPLPSASGSSTSSASLLPSDSQTATPTAPGTLTQTDSETVSPADTHTVTATRSLPPTPTRSGTHSIPLTPSPIASRSKSITGTRSLLPTPTKEATPSMTFSASSTRIFCRLPSVPVTCRCANKEVKLRIDTIGWAFVPPANNRVELEPYVVSVHPSAGSIDGNQLVTVHGYGFSSNTIIEFGTGSILASSARRPYEIVSQTHNVTVLRTTTPSAGTFHVNVLAPFSSTIRYTVCRNVEDPTACRFSFTVSATPNISSSSFDPATGIASFTGTLLAAAPEDINITFSGRPCPISSFSGSTVECAVPANLPAGQHVSWMVVHPHGNATGTPVVVSPHLNITTVSPLVSSLGGGRAITVNGLGFGNSLSAANVTLAGVACDVQSISPTSLVCITAATSKELDGAVLLNVDGVEAQLLDMATGEPINFVYSAAVTHNITAVVPEVGPAMGGTALTIYGAGLSTAHLITIGGVVCAQSPEEQAASIATGGSALFCTTGTHPGTEVPLSVVVHDTEFGDAAIMGVENSTEHSTTFQYLDMWSSGTTWPTGIPPYAGADVIVERGKVVMLDVSPPRLGNVIIRGELHFLRTRDILFEATTIFVDGGAFHVGSPHRPFTRQCTIRLFGNRMTPEVPDFGTKAIIVRDGALSIHGIARTQTWTTLARTVDTGGSILHLRGPLLDWFPGDRIVVGPTDFEMFEAEERVIAEIDHTNETSIVTINAPLRVAHFGERQCFNPPAHINNNATDSSGNSSAIDEGVAPLCVDESAEVILLSRNVVVEGDEESLLNGIGVTIVIQPLRDGADTYGRLSFVEIRNAGVAHMHGRSPIHFARCGTSTSSFVVGCAIHRSLNRGINVVAAMELTISQNVLFDISGNGIALDSGFELRNVIHRNVVMQTKSCTHCMNQDVHAGSFWFANPMQNFTENRAAGSDGDGIRFALLSSANNHSNIGAYEGQYTSISPHLLAIIDFWGNVAHSNRGNGLSMEPQWRPQYDLLYPYSAGFSSNVPLVLSGFTAFKNERNGVYTRFTGMIVFDNFVLADNGRQEPDSAGFWTDNVNAAQNQTAGITNSTFIALTSNRPFRRAATRSGINLPTDDNWFVSNVTFVNYEEENWALEPHRHGDERSLQWTWGWQYTFEKIRYVNSSNKLRIRFRHHCIAHDLDGSLTGYTDHQLVPFSVLYNNMTCTNFTEWGEDLPFPLQLCPPHYRIRRVDGSISRTYRLRDTTTSDTSGTRFGNIRWSHDGATETVLNLDFNFVVTLPINDTEFKTAFDSFDSPESWMFRFSPRYYQPSERLMMHFHLHEFRWSQNATIDNKEQLLSPWRRPTLTSVGNQSGTYFSNDRIISVFIWRPFTTVNFYAVMCPPFFGSFTREPTPTVSNSTTRSAGSRSFSADETMSATETESASATVTASETGSSSATLVATESATGSVSLPVTPSATITNTITLTGSSSASPSSSTSQSPSHSATPSASIPPTATLTASNSPAPTSTATATVTITPTRSASRSDTVTPPPTRTWTFTTTPSFTPTRTREATPTHPATPTVLLTPPPLTPIPPTPAPPPGALPVFVFNFGGPPVTPPPTTMPPGSTSDGGGGGDGGGGSAPAAPGAGFGEGSDGSSLAPGSTSDGSDGGDGGGGSAPAASGAGFDGGSDGSSFAPGSTSDGGGGGDGGGGSAPAAPGAGFDGGSDGSSFAPGSTSDGSDGGGGSAPAAPVDGFGGGGDGKVPGLGVPGDAGAGTAFTPPQTPAPLSVLFPGSVELDRDAYFDDDDLQNGDESSTDGGASGGEDGDGDGGGGSGVTSSGETSENQQDGTTGEGTPPTATSPAAVSGSSPPPPPPVDSPGGPEDDGGSGDTPTFPLSPGTTVSTDVTFFDNSSGVHPPPAGNGTFIEIGIEDGAFLELRATGANCTQTNGSSINPELTKGTWFRCEPTILVVGDQPIPQPMTLEVVMGSVPCAAETERGTVLVHAGVLFVNPQNESESEAYLSMQEIPTTLATAASPPSNSSTGSNGTRVPIVDRMWPRSLQEMREGEKVTLYGRNFDRLPTDFVLLGSVASPLYRVSDAVATFWIPTNFSDVFDNPQRNPNARARNYRRLLLQGNPRAFELVDAFVSAAHAGSGGDRTAKAPHNFVPSFGCAALIAPGFQWSIEDGYDTPTAIVPAGQVTMVSSVRDAHAPLSLARPAAPERAGSFANLEHVFPLLDATGAEPARWGIVGGVGRGLTQLGSDADARIVAGSLRDGLPLRLSIAVASANNSDPVGQVDAVLRAPFARAALFRDLAREVPGVNLSTRPIGRYTTAVTITPSTIVPLYSTRITIEAEDAPTSLVLEASSSQCRWLPTAFMLECLFAVIDHPAADSSTRRHMEEAGGAAHDASTLSVAAVGLPSFFSSELRVIIHVAPQNARARAQRGWLVRDPARWIPPPPGSENVSASIPPGLPHLPGADESAPGSEQNGTTERAPPSGPVAAGSIRVSNVFEDGCGQAITHFIIYVFAAFIVLAAARAIHQLVRTRRDSPADLAAIQTTQLGVLRGLLPLHVWVGLLFPFHAYSGTTQTNAALCQVLALCAFASTLFNSFGYMMQDNAVTEAAFLGSATAALAVWLRLPVHYYYSTYTVIDRRHEAQAKLRRYLVQKTAIRDGEEWDGVQEQTLASVATVRHPNPDDLAAAAGSPISPSVAGLRGAPQNNMFDQLEFVDLEDGDDIDVTPGVAAGFAMAGDRDIVLPSEGAIDVDVFDSIVLFDENDGDGSAELSTAVKSKRPQKAGGAAADRELPPPSPPRAPLPRPSILTQTLSASSASGLREEAAAASARGGDAPHAKMASGLDELFTGDDAAELVPVVFDDLTMSVSSDAGSHYSLGDSMAHQQAAAQQQNLQRGQESGLGDTVSALKKRRNMPMYDANATVSSSSSVVRVLPISEETGKKPAAASASAGPRIDAPPVRGLTGFIADRKHGDSSPEAGGKGARLDVDELEDDLVILYDAPPTPVDHAAERRAIAHRVFFAQRSGAPAGGCAAFDDEALAASSPRGRTSESGSGSGSGSGGGGGGVEAAAAAAAVSTPSTHMAVPCCNNSIEDFDSARLPHSFPALENFSFFSTRTRRGVLQLDESSHTCSWKGGASSSSGGGRGGVAASHVFVVSKRYRVMGHLFVAALVVGLSLYILSATSNYCAGEYAGFARVLAGAVVADVLAVQPLFVVLVALYRWLVASSTSTTSTSSSGIDAGLHTAYPIHMQPIPQHDQHNL